MNNGAIDNLIKLRIFLEYLCDGFSKSDLNKDTLLSTKNKILFVLEKKDATPSELTMALSIAKSNLANTLKSMTNENLVISYKNSDRAKYVYYQITDKGRQVLKEYKDKVFGNVISRCHNIDDVAVQLEKIIQIIKGE